MKPYLIFFFIAILITSSSCERKSVDQIFPFEAEVLGKNLDCKKNEIKFYNDLDKVIKLFGKSVIDSVYIAGNLPEDLQIPGLKIVLNIGTSSNYQYGACTTMGPTLNWVWITNAKPK